MKTRAFLLLTLATAFATLPACGAADDDGAEADEANLVSGLGTTTIRSEAQYLELSIEGGGFGQAGRLMKFLVDARNRAKKTAYFINGNYKVDGKTPSYAKYHYDFAKQQLGITENAGTFNDVTYFTDDKRYYAGTIQTYQLGEGKPLYAVQLYPDDVIHEEGILELAKVIRAQFQVPGARMAFVAGGPQQTFARVKGQLAAIGFEAFTIDEVLGNVKYLPLNPGEAWGYLRIFPADYGNLRPTDIVVFDELPLDLSVVAGTITKVYQDVTSHVNLKSKERGTPNMVMRDASPGNPKLAAFADKPVHLVVGKTGYTIEATTPQIVEQKLRERTNKPWQQLPVVVEKNLVRYDDMCPSLSTACTQQGNRFGGKAANIGFLANRNVLGRAGQPGSQSAKLGYDLVPHGFAIPVQWYRDFVDFPANAALKAKLGELVTKEKAGVLSPNERKALSVELQALFHKGTVPPAQLEAVNKAIAELRAVEPAMQKMKFRSSANAEDIPNFDGAGLHDSFAVKLSSVDAPDMACRLETEQDGVVTKLEIKPKTPQCGIKGVFASLWNTRAIEERSFARLDHATASMGIAVVPAYDTESEVAANGVIITRSVNSDFLAYTLSLQQGNNLVTNPDPGTISQMTLATFSDGSRPTQFTIVRRATPVAGGSPLTTSVLDNGQMNQVTELAKVVEQAYCRVKPGYYGGDCRYVWLDSDKERSLDMEFKFLQNGQFVLKQSREFHGR
ncbi:MAG TPA: PEP/pyruvate-binding domain-containing protein [Labilithrix sp.]|nr:PEP/pyruvate-binding domain-containing protein [Labilithrix sp.]